MSDRLEHFIKNNRDQFDDKTPSLKVWANIEKRLEPPTAKRFSILRILSVAASVVILLCVGAVGGQYFSSSKNAAEVATSLEDFSTEYGKLERDFQKKITSKRAQLANYNYDATVNEDLTDLDKTLEELRGELKNVPKGSEEQIVEAMLKNYETKVAILNIVLEKIVLTQSKSGAENEGAEM